MSNAITIGNGSGNGNGFSGDGGGSDKLSSSSSSSSPAMMILHVNPLYHRSQIASPAPGPAPELGQGTAPGQGPVDVLPRHRGRQI